MLTLFFAAFIFCMLLHLENDKLRLVLPIESEEVTTTIDYGDLTQGEDGDYFDEEMTKRLHMFNTLKKGKKQFCTG